LQTITTTDSPPPPLKKQCHSERSAAQAARREESLIFPTAMTRAAPPRLSDASGETNTQKQAQKR
jgi:hypothetical protein